MDFALLIRGNQQDSPRRWLETGTRDDACESRTYVPEVERLVQFLTRRYVHAAVFTSLRTVLPFGHTCRYHQSRLEAAMTVTTPLWPVPITTVGRSRGGTVVFMRGGKLH